MLRRVSGAEPQVVGLAPRTTMKGRSSTMKTFILRNQNTVEPQKPARPATVAFYLSQLGCGGLRDTLPLNRAAEPATSCYWGKYFRASSDTEHRALLAHRGQWLWGRPLSGGVRPSSGAAGDSIAN